MILGFSRKTNLLMHFPKKEYSNIDLDYFKIYSNYPILHFLRHFNIMLILLLVNFIFIKDDVLPVLYI